MTMEQLNALPEERAVAEFRRCCGSERWAGSMARARPFRDFESLEVVAGVVWAALERADWLEAFAAHPRIGERAGGAGRTGGANDAGWAAHEQSGAANADDAVKIRLAQLNSDYEARFGYIFIVCATGKSASEMLAMLEGRLSNDFERELPIAAEQQRQITRLRLAKLLER